MSIIEAERELFKQWATTRKPFVSDGIVDETAYLDSKMKILFILKEVSECGDQDWDLREFIRNGACSATWNNITRWVYGIRNLNKEINWKEIEQPFSIDFRKQQLKSICTINLKKSPGHAECDNEQLRIISGLDKENLNRQFSLYTPDLIICCGTSDLFHSLVKVKENIEWQTTSRGIRYYKVGENRHLIAYLHPQAHIHANFMYYGLIDAIKEIRGIVPASAVSIP